MKTRFNLSVIALLTLGSTFAMADNPYYNDHYNSPGYLNPQEEIATTTITTTNEDTTELILNNTDRREKKEQKSLNDNFSSLVVMDSEKSSMSSNGSKGTSTAFRMNYDKELAPTQDIGVLFSYKNTKIDDLSLKSKNMVLSPYYKYYHDINDKIDVMAVANGVLALKSTTSTSGDIDVFEYGLGIGVVPNYYVNDKLLFSLPVGIQTSASNVTKEPAGSNLDINTLSQLNYGLGTEYMIKPTWLVNADVLQTQEIGGSDVAKDNALYYNLRTTYHSEAWNYVLGYKTVKNVDNYKEDTYMLSVGYNW